MKTFKQQAEEFGRKEIKIIVKDKISEFRELRAGSEQYEHNWRKQAIHGIQGIPEAQKWFYEWQIEEAMDDKMRIEKKIWLWENRLRVLNGGKDKSKSFDLEVIKQIPIGSLLEKPTSETKDKVWYKCMFHNEDTASFMWDKKSNRFKCFGCNKYGTVIDIYMQLYGVNFIDACKALSKI